MQAQPAVMDDRLAHCAAALEEARREVETLTDSVAHELRAPLRAMHGFAQALLEDFGVQLGEDGRGYATRVITAAQRMDRLMQDLAAYGRVYRREIPRRRVELDALLPEILEDIAAQFRGRGATIRIASPLPAVRANRSLLRQILHHLLANAVKFVAPGVSPRVEITAEPNADYVRVRVGDNGVGIAGEHLDRIFRPFERLHGIEAYAGSGMGLALVHKGIQRLDGRVGVESTPGQGSCFWIELPAAEVRYGESELHDPAGGGQHG